MQSESAFRAVESYRQNGKNRWQYQCVIVLVQSGQMLTAGAWDLRLGTACALCLGSGIMAESLLEVLPDLIVLVQRDGTVIGCAGGGGVGHLKPTDPEGQMLESCWPAPVAQLLKQLIRKAIATRAPSEARFEDAGVAFEARVSAQGPQRAICVIRPTLIAPREDSLDLTDERPRPQLDRRG